jgi:hypothetical protein
MPDGQVAEVCVITGAMQRVLGPLLCAGIFLGCSQGEGEICQINNDCGSGLICSSGTRTCQRPGAGSGTPDGGVKKDAAVDAASNADAGDGDAGY